MNLEALVRFMVPRIEVEYAILAPLAPDRDCTVTAPMAHLDIDDDVTMGDLTEALTRALSIVRDVQLWMHSDGRSALLMQCRPWSETQGAA